MLAILVSENIMILLCNVYTIIISLPAQSNWTPMSSRSSTVIVLTCKRCCGICCSLQTPVELRSRVQGKRTPVSLRLPKPTRTLHIVTTANREGITNTRRHFQIYIWFMFINIHQRILSLNPRSTWQRIIYVPLSVSVWRSLASGRIWCLWLSPAGWYPARAM